MRRRRVGEDQGALFNILDNDSYDLVETQQKCCPRCKQVKPLTQFYRSKNTKDGRETKCAACDYDRKQAPAYREFERNRWHLRVDRNPNYPLIKSANKRIKDFEQLKREYDYVP